MINGYDNYKLTVNNLNSINADTITTKNFNVDKDGNIYGASLYINNQLIDFTSYLTASYLTNYVLTTTLNSTLANYVLTTTLNSTLANYVLTSTLSNYVTNSSLSSTLNNYVTTGMIGSYRLINDSWSRGDTTNEIQIRTGYTTDLNGNIQTCKSVDDGIITELALANVNIAVLNGTMTTTNATVAGLVLNVGTLNGQVSTIQGEITTLNGQVTTLQGKTQNITATAGVTNIGGTVSTTNVTASTLAVPTGSHTLNIGNNLYGGILTDNINIGTGLGFNNVNILGVLYINGVPFVPFNVASPLTQW